MPFEAVHNEKELLLQVSQGDRDAFKLLYTHYFSFVKQYVALFERSEQGLDELTQDVFVRIWEKRVYLAKVESFRGYIFMITRNVVFNYLRALKVHQRIRELDESPERSGGGDVESEFLFKQYYQLALEAMEQLPAGRHKILKMSIEDGFSLDEIAAKLDISRSGVKKQLYAATAFVREYLREHGDLTLLLFVFLSLFEI